MKKLIATLCVVFAVGAASAYTPNKIVIPDIEGYKTLKCDFHMHTIFSDGNVWPSTRVKEAVWEGMDVIAITEHLDTRHQKMVNQGYFTKEKNDRNRSYEIAKEAAKGTNVIVIHGGELTREMAPGHWNCIFVKDNEKIVKEEESHGDDHFLSVQAGLKEAHAQGAFTFWNHPQWNKHAPNKTKWYPEHTKLLKEGYMNGIEVYNGEYCPEAHGWALKYNLTMFANSDCHGPLFYSYDYLHGEHRPVTLVFAKERSEAGIREALDNQRTVAFAEGMVYGREDNVRALYDASVKIIAVTHDWRSTKITIENCSSVPLRFSKAPGSEEWSYTREWEIAPHSIKTLDVKALQKDHKYQEITAKEIDVNLFVNTYMVGPGEPLKVHYNIKREYTGK